MIGELAIGERWFAAAAAAWLKQDLLARAIVDPSLKVQWANQAAIDLLGERNGIELHGEILRATESAEHERLMSLVRHADGHISSCCVEKIDGIGHFLIRAQSLPKMEPAVVALMFVDTDLPGSAAYRDLDRAFGLTQSEHRILLSLLEGQEADALSRSFGISIETVRSHIRSIYTKLHVNSRERLFYKVQPFRL